MAAWKVEKHQYGNYLLLCLIVGSNICKYIEFV